MTESAAQVVSTLQSGSADIQTLIEDVAEALRYEVSDELIEHINTVLSELINLDIIAAL